MYCLNTDTHIFLYVTASPGVCQAVLMSLRGFPMLEDVQTHTRSLFFSPRFCPKMSSDCYRIVCEYSREPKLGLLPRGSSLPDGALPQWDRPRKQTILKIPFSHKERIRSFPISITNPMVLQFRLDLKQTRKIKISKRDSRETNREMPVSHTSHSSATISD